MPEVSIIIAAYNSEKFIAKTIESVLQQTFLNWELIIVDDGSIDQTKIIISKYLVDSRIKYIYQKNNGQARARNNGFKICKGNYIAILDHDDLWEKTKLEKQVEQFEKNNSLGLVYCGALNIDYYDRVLNRKTNYDVTSDTLMHIFSSNHIPFSSMLIRRNAIVGELHDERYPFNGDYYLTIRLALNGWKFGFVNENLLFYRILNNSLSRNANALSMFYSEQISFYNLELKNNIKINKMYLNKYLANSFLIYSNGLINNKNKDKLFTARILAIRAGFLNPEPKFLISCFRKLLKSFFTVHNCAK